MSQSSSIAITGSGIISAIGKDKPSTLHSLLQQQTGIGPMRYLASAYHQYPVGEVKSSSQELKSMLGIPPSRIVSRTVLLGAVAAKEALTDARIADLTGRRVAFISGTTVGGMDVTETFFDQMLGGAKEAVEIIRHHDCGSSSHEIADLCGLQAQVCTISTACSSALNAIMLGCEMLRRGEADLVVAGGSESLSKFHFNGFRSLMILSTERCCPFDNNSAGINLGEGAAYLVLERHDDAIARDANVEGYVAGYANRCDAFHQTATSPDGEGAFLAMSEALSMAHLRPEEISYINAHGTGTANNDRSESAAIGRVFGSHKPPVSSTKGFTGHTTSASGSIEAVTCLLAMREGFIPANLGWRMAMEHGIEPSLGSSGVELDNVLCNSFGFGGNCSSLIISRTPRHAPVQGPRRKWRIAATAEVTPETDLRQVRDYVPGAQARRMGKLLKAATIASGKALRQAGIACPEAIVSATGWGMLETSEHFLRDMTSNGEQSLSPTLFMQSTHNTIGSAIAILNKAKGYNTTYTQGEESLEWALRDAQRLIEDGHADSVLVGCYEESTPTYDHFLQLLGSRARDSVHCGCWVLTLAE